MYLCTLVKHSAMNNKKEGEYYSQMVRRYKDEYGGKNLQDFCIKEKVSFNKMLHCLRNDSYRKPKQARIVKSESNSPYERKAMLG